MTIEYREPSLFSESEAFTIKASLHPNGLSMEFRVYLANRDEEDDWDYGGFLKSDGCLNWETSPFCMAHFCELDEIRILREAFDAVGDLAALHIPSYTGSFGRKPT